MTAISGVNSRFDTMLAVSLLIHVKGLASEVVPSELRNQITQTFRKPVERQHNLKLKSVVGNTTPETLDMPSR